MKNTTTVSEFSPPHAVIIIGAGIGTWLDNEFLQLLAMIYLVFFAALALIALITPIRYIHTHLDKAETQGDRGDWNMLTIVILTMLEWYIGTGIMIFATIASLVVKKQWQKYKQPSLNTNMGHP